MKHRNFLAISLMMLYCVTSICQSNERIFYSSFSPQDWDIYLSENAGKTFEPFTTHPSLDYDAVISPDGKWVVYTSERSGIPQLYVKAIDGHQPAKLLLRSNSFQDQATFSPNGKQLAFVASHEGNAEIYLIKFFPDSLQDISSALNLSRHPGGDFRPSFSPDGELIAFSSDRDHTIVPHPHFPFARQRTGDIYTMDINGTKVKRLTNTQAWDGSPVWTADGSKIVFYSQRHGISSLFQMNPDGSGQKQILEFSGPAVSPALLEDGKISFTTWKSEQDFKIMLADTSANEIRPMLSNAPDLMFNLDVHPSGFMVFHGGKYAAQHDMPGKFGFDGDPLAKVPDSLRLADKQVNVYAVRRAFAAPPQLGSTFLFYNASDLQDFFAWIKPMGYSIFWIPLLVVAFFVLSIVFGIRNRKKVSFWKYLLFGILAVVFGSLTAGTFAYVDFINPMPVSIIRLVMGLLTILLIALGWWQYRRYRQQREKNADVPLLSKLYSSLFFGLAIFGLLCVAFINQFVHSKLYFYQLDYVSGEKSKVFSLDKETDTNPSNFQVLDSKVTSNGKSFVFTTGSFRGNAKTQGDIWKYNFESKEISKISDSPYNDGFADFSEDGKMVYRSGRTGDFDIYFKAGDSLINLTNDIHRDNFPAISKNGDKIVFASDRLRSESEYKTMDIFLMKLNPDNTWSAPRKISSGEGQNAHPHFSPDGEWVIYTTEAYGINDEQALVQPIIFSPQMYGEIAAYNLNKKERIRLTHNKWEEGAPLWVE